MKIKSVEAYWVHIPIPHGAAAHQRFRPHHCRSTATLVRIDTECGLTGWGEAKAQVGGMAQNQALTCMINEEFAPLLIGEDPRDITRLWETLYSGTPRPLRAARGPRVSGARAPRHHGLGDQRRRLRAVGHPRQVARRAGVAAARRTARREDAGLCLGRLGRPRQDRRAAARLCRSAAASGRSRCGSASSTATRAIRRAACGRRARRWARRSG